MSWANVRGHDRLSLAFRDILRRGRLGHAYLFVGPSGIGKRTFAVELARALLCERHDQTEPEACGRCPACVQVEAKTHPDYHLVDLPEDKHEFPIEEMQRLIAHLALKPARGRHRVALVDDAERLSTEAANCFLKTLEEPPPASLLVLIASSVEQLLPTIRSRCQIVRFAPLPVDVLAELIAAEGLAEQPEAARRLAEMSRGSLEHARWLARPEVQDLRKRLAELLRSRPVPSVALGQELVRFAEEGAKESAVKRQRARFALSLIADDLTGQLHERLRQGDAEQTERLTDALDRVVAAEEQVDRWLQLALVLESCADAVAQSLA